MLWLLFAVVTAEIFVTYTRTPPRELYYVSGSGVHLELHQALLFLGFPTGLVAIAAAGVVADRIPNRVVVTALGAVAFVTNGADEAEADVRAVSALSLAGVACAFALTIAAAQYGGE